ncbi:2-oxo-4-hydroxy-4-carboxy-5-ureidoimidazoline decarboxylase [Myxococcus dinghuensis]|uniref:2-oxo-4-hydroxy-4-carboxy-5-ureidoimidazoline decarboxylase n=1 Tax=Myxococcus dinghuensis TaxID=2906761 RepID=UPI002B20E3C9|nr:2-oxo-4-hydroxy-4-carboxy-5-ureidoimidazoline decarboxylase [Myxococcus dinghuensis]
MSALERLNRMFPNEAKAELMRCCGSSRWADGMTRARPFRDAAHLLAESEWLWKQTGPEDWREAMTHHPRIGESALRAKFAATASWSSQEQGGVRGASEDVIRGLAEGNQAYEARFGFIFLVCATGKGAEEMLALLRERMDNAPDEELRVAAGEQAKITRIRLEKLLAS